MPDIGFYHPIVIHFAIGLLAVGVLFRWISLTGRAAFAGPAAASVILLATVATVVAAQSGENAHVAVEAVPGAAGAVRAHQLWGERTRNLAVAIGGLELLALAFRGRTTARRILFASAGLGVVAVLSVLETGKLGGELVYAHAGGVGIRSGDPEDVARLLLAGLVAQAELDEKAGPPRRRGEPARDGRADASRPIPRSRSGPPRRCSRIGTTPRAPSRSSHGSAPLRTSHSCASAAAWLTADALDALGRRAEARVVLERLRTEFPENTRLRGRLARADARPPTNSQP